MTNEPNLEPPEERTPDDTTDPFRELDALVATRVMKLRNVEKKWVVPQKIPGVIEVYDVAEHSDAELLERGLIAYVDYCAQIDTSMYADASTEYVKRHSYYQIPFYSTDISDAWIIVEKLVAEGHVFIVKGDGLRDGSHRKRWTVLCDNLPRFDSETAPKAICLAALALASKEKEQLLHTSTKILNKLKERQEGKTEEK